MPNYTVTLTDEQADAVADMNPGRSIVDILQGSVSARAQSAVSTRAESIMRKVMGSVPLTAKEKSLADARISKITVKG